MLRLRALLALSVLLAAALVAATAPAAHAEFFTHKVAYVYDNTLFPGTGGEVGVSDPTAPPGGGGSVFVNAISGTPLGKAGEGNYTPSGGVETTFKSITLAELDAKPKLLEEGGFDTALMYETCTIGSHPTAMAAINAFLETAHKAIILDADGCSSGAKGEPNWSGFVFPFATNNPGPDGAEGPYTAVEPSSLTAGLSVGPQEKDAVGDANIFTTASSHWFQAIAATNVQGVNGTVMAYSRTASGGLALYEGEDFWFTDEPDAHLKTVFDNLLNQHWNPDKLPNSSFVCKTCASTVATKLSSTIVPAGTAVTDSATVNGASPAGTAVGKVTFTVYSDSKCQLPVAGQAQAVPVATGGATTSPIVLPPGVYYFQAQYSGDTNNFPGASACGSEVLTVVPINPPKEKSPPKFLEKAFEIEWEVEFPEGGEIEFEGELLEAAELASLHHGSAFSIVGVTATTKGKPKHCKKGFVKKHGKCYSRAPIRFGPHKLTIPAAGVYKLRIKPTASVIAGLKKGKTLTVRFHLVFTPALTMVHITKTANVKLHLKPKKKKKHKK